jgi:hypothetical protein
MVVEIADKMIDLTGLENHRYLDIEYPVHDEIAQAFVENWFSFSIF